MNILADSLQRSLLRVSLVLSLHALACSRAEYDLKRPFEQASDLVVEYGQIGQTTRPFVRIPPAGKRASEIPLGSVRRGFLRTHLAIDPGTGGASAELELRGEGLLSKLLKDETSTCRHEWPRAAEPQGWVDCHLPIRRNHRSATLSIRFDGPDGSALRVSSAIVIAADPPPKADVFVIVLDTARADSFVSFNQHARFGTQLDALARDSIVFDELRAPSSWTRASVASLITGLPQARHRVFDRLHTLSPDLTTLQSHLQRNGYLTLAWSTNPNILPLWGFANGFDEFVDAGVPDWSRKKTDASDVFSLARASLKANRDVNALYYLHFMDPHSPYLPPEASLQKVQAIPRHEQRRFPIPIDATARGRAARSDYRRYLAEIHDLDAQLGSFFDLLKQIGRYEGSLILVVSDHGEEFLDYGNQYHGQNLYEESLRVPGILKLPGNERAGTRIGRAVGLADLLPTILSALGLSAPPGIDGRDVLGSEGPELPQFARLILDGQRMAMVKFQNWKLIVDYASEGVELYDLAQDPKEQANLREVQEKKAGELRALLDRMAAMHADGWHLRGCGCAEKSVLELQIRGSEAETTRIEFEEGDTIDPLAEDEGFEVTFDLTPAVTRQERFNRAISVILPDEDEIVLHRSNSDPADARWSIRPGTPEGLMVAAGNREPRHLDDWLELSTTIDESEIQVGEPVECREPRSDASRGMADDGGTCRPYVRIWHVRPPRAISKSEVDPSTREQLRALGYAW